MNKNILIYILLFITITVFSQKKYAGRILYKVTLIPIDKSKNLEIDKIPTEDRQKAQAIIQNIKMLIFF